MILLLRNYVSQNNELWLLLRQWIVNTGDTMLISSITSFIEQ